MLARSIDEGGRGRRAAGARRRTRSTRCPASPASMEALSIRVKLVVRRRFARRTRRPRWRNLVLPDHTLARDAGATPHRDRACARSSSRRSARCFDTQALGDTLLGVARAIGGDTAGPRCRRDRSRACSRATGPERIGARRSPTAANSARSRSAARFRSRHRPAHFDRRRRRLQGSGDFTVVAYPHSFLLVRRARSGASVVAGDSRPGHEAVLEQLGRDQLDGQGRRARRRRSATS